MTVELFKTTYNDKVTYAYFDSGFIVELATLFIRNLVSLIGYSYSAKSVNEYAKALKYILNWIKITKPYPNLSIDETLKILTRKDIEDWIKSQKLNRNTIRQREAIFKEFLGFLTSEEGLRSRSEFDNPYRTGKLITKGTKNYKKPQYLTEQQVIILLNGFKNESERTLWHFCYDVGLRSSELIRLKRKSLPNPALFSSGLKYYPIYIDGSKGQGGQIKERISIISKIVLDRILKYHQSYNYRFSPDYAENDLNKPVFLSVHGKHLTEDAIGKQMKSSAKRAGLNPDDYHPHSLRHGFAFSLLRSDLTKDYQDGLLLLNSCLGHVLLESTEIYTQIPPTVLNRFNEGEKSTDKYEEAKRIYEATFLPPRKNTEKRGHR